MNKCRKKVLKNSVDPLGLTPIEVLSTLPKIKDQRP